MDLVNTLSNFETLLTTVICLASLAAIVSVVIEMKLHRNLRAKTMHYLIQRRYKRRMKGVLYTFPVLPPYTKQEGGGYRCPACGAVAKTDVKVTPERDNYALSCTKCTWHKPSVWQYLRTESEQRHLVGLVSFAVSQRRLDEDVLMRAWEADFESTEPIVPPVYPTNWRKR